MNISHLLLGAFVLCALPAVAQPEQKPINGLPYPLIPLQEAARIAETKPIKLHLRDVTVRDALEEIERQTGFPINTVTVTAVDIELLDKKLSLDIETSSFKEASDAVFEEAGVKAMLSSWNNNGVWQVTPKNISINEEDGPSSGTEPLQVRALRGSIQSSKEISFSKKEKFLNQSNNFNLWLTMVTPPQLPFLGTSEVKVTRADDDQGRSLILKPDQRNPFRFAMMGRSGRQLNVTLEPPQPTSRALSHLEGSVICLLAKQYETWEVPDVLNTKDTTHQFDVSGERVRLSIKPTMLADSIALEIQATTSVDTMPNMNIGGPRFRNPMMEINQYSSMVRLIDANGQILETNGGGGSSSSKETKAQMNFRPPTKPFVPFVMKDGEKVPGPPPPPPVLVGPFKLVIKAPTEIVQTEVPFSFSNLPLPN